MKKTYFVLRVITFLLVLLLPSLALASSWDQINQSIVRPQGWQQIVKNSPFTLGAACLYSADNPVLVAQWGSYPSIDGSTVCVPLGMELARQHLGLQESDLNGFITFSTTHSAYERLILGKPNPNVSIMSRQTALDPQHPVDLILATEPSDEEQALAKQHSVELVMQPFCYDAFVFLVNSKNPVDSLTVEQIQQIYSGQIREWGIVGGMAEALIEAYQRPHNSGSQTAMEQMVMRGKPLTVAESNYISDGMSDLVAQVGNYNNGRQAIGYSYLYYVDALYKAGNIKVLHINGIAPEADNLSSGKYPFTVSYYAVYKKGDENAARFATWLVGEEGQRCVQQAGYIPILQDKKDK